MSLSIGDKVFLVIALADFAGIFLWLGICLHLAYTKMDLILEHLKNSSIVAFWATFRYGGPWGKLLVIGSISGIVTFPKRHIKRGMLSTEELAGFPVALKLKLVRLQWSALGLIAVMMTLGIAIKLGLI
jgi:hypothetical protein